MLDVRTFHRVNIESDHYLAKKRMRLCNAKNVQSSTQRKLDVVKLQSQWADDTSDAGKF